MTWIGRRALVPADRTGPFSYARFHLVLTPATAKAAAHHTRTAKAAMANTGTAKAAVHHARTPKTAVGKTGTSKAAM